MGFVSRFLDRRNWRRRARAYVRLLQKDPEESDARWLAELDRHPDLDHASWELRYARMALGQLSAERDALDDRVGAVVARELLASFASDRRIGAGMLDVAQRQFNVRLGQYREALARREHPDPVQLRFARELLVFTHGDRRFDMPALERAGEILRRYSAEFNVALQDAFGRATLPEDVKPSEATAA